MLVFCRNLTGFLTCWQRTCNNAIQNYYQLVFDKGKETDGDNVS